MTRLRIVIVDGDAGAAVYLVDAAGEAWRVYDGVGERAGRRDAVAPPDGLATHRLFISRAGARRAYLFRGRESRALVPRLLAAQLSAARPLRRDGGPPGR